jgi:hypothetical protein
MRIAEEIFRIKQMMLLSESNVITEASKIDILVNKVGLTQRNAELIERICGKLSVFIVNKLYKELERDYRLVHTNSVISNDEVQEFVKKSLNTSTIRELNNFSSIMDYIRVGLNGNISTLKDLKYFEIYDLSKKWHDSLEIGEGKINYIEPKENTIILDFRDDNGIGYYWVDLNTKKSDEECERMGHCGTSSVGYIYSLRSTTRINEKFTINKSHVTAAIGTNGLIYQMKGPKNSKPKQIYHKYILDLFYLIIDNEYFIQGFGVEYESENDFKITDLPNDVIIELYNNRPDLFKNFTLKLKLYNLKVIDKNDFDHNFILDLEPNDISVYVDGDYVVNRYNKTYTTDSGKTYKEEFKIGLFQSILSGEMYYDYGFENSDWKHILDYYVNSINEQRIRSLIRGRAVPDSLTDEEFDNESTTVLIEEFDLDDEIINCILWSMNDAEESEYFSYKYNELKKCLEFYGNVIEMNDTGVKIDVDFIDLVNSIDEKYIDEYLENCNQDLKCTLGEIVYYGDFDKPKFEISEYYSPSVKKSDYNDILDSKLDDITNY